MPRMMMQLTVLPKIQLLFVLFMMSLLNFHMNAVLFEKEVFVIFYMSRLEIIQMGPVFRSNETS